MNELLEFVGHAGTRLRGEARGDARGSTVLLLHGGGQTRHAWRHTTSRLANAGFRVVAVDQRGHGDSAWAQDGDYSIDAFKNDVVRMAAQLGTLPVVVGASLGGIAALLAEGETLEPLLSGLVLVDVAPRVDPVGVARIRQFMTANLEGFDTLDDAAAAVAAYARSRPRPSDATGLRKNLRVGDDGRLRWHWDPAFMMGPRRPQATRHHARLLAAARRLTVPALLVRGLSSDVVSDEGVREFLAAVPHAELVDVRGAGHMVAGDRNDAFAVAVVAFLVRRFAVAADRST